MEELDYNGNKTSGLLNIVENPNSYKCSCKCIFDIHCLRDSKGFFHNRCHKYLTKKQLLKDSLRLAR